MSFESKTEKVGSVLGRTAGKVVNAAGKVANAPSTVAESAGDAYGRTVTAKIKREKRALPDEINIVDLFHKKIFSFVDFDFVLSCLRDNKLASCEGIYTISSLSNELLPKVTEESLLKRDARNVLELFPAIVRLCVRRRKGLLVHVDLIAGKVKKLDRIETFIQYLGIANGIQLRDLVFPTEYAIPKLRGRVMSRKVISDKKLDALEDVVKPAEDDETDNTSEPGGNRPLSTARKSRAAYIEDIASTTTGFEDIRSDTSLFSSQKMSYVELFRMKRKHALDCDDAASLDRSDIFNTLMFYLIDRLPQTKDIDIKDINSYINGVAGVYADSGLTDFMSCIKNSSQGFASCLRVLYELPEGSGDSDNDWYIATLRLAEKAFGVSREHIKNFSRATDKTETLRMILECVLDVIAHEKAAELHETEVLQKDSGRTSAFGDPYPLFSEQFDAAAHSSLSKVQEAAQNLRVSNETEDIL